MQYKSFLLAFSIIISVTANGQQYQKFSMAGGNSKRVHTDTIVLKTEYKQDKTPAVLAPEPEPYKPVPLAGQKAYFGSMNDYVLNYTRQYMEAHNRTLSVVQTRSTSHFSLIDNVLQKYNIPKELKYLAVIESALNHNAVSPVGAVGPWQFMASTARLMGLTVNKKRDDRKDWFKSTNAAAKYLSYLYGELNDWLLVIAAYNSGPTPVQRAIQRTGSTNFWDIKKYLPRETQGHVLAFIATASIFENMSKFIGMNNLPIDFSVTDESGNVEIKKAARIVFTEEELKNMAIVRIAEPLNMDLLSQDLKIERKLLEKWNPDYDLFEMDNYEGTFYSLRIPKEKLDNFIDRKEYLTKRSRIMYSEMSL